MSKSTNTVVYFDWKTVIYIYVCGKCRTQCMLPMEKSVTFTGACANEIIPNGQLTRLLTKRKKEVMLESFYLLNEGILFQLQLQQWLQLRFPSKPMCMWLLYREISYEWRLRYNDYSRMLPLPWFGEFVLFVICLFVCYL